MAGATVKEMREEVPVFLRNMDPLKVRLVHRLATTMTREVEQTVDAPDALFSVAFARAFGTQLLLHHATYESPVREKAFEYVLRNAARNVGHAARVNENAPPASEDVCLDDTRLSLKTETAKKPREGAIGIEKLMEARWIRDSHTPTELAAGVGRVIPEHLARYERLVMLRSWPGADSVHYTLVEIPKDVLMLATGLVGDDFEPKNEKGSSGADVFKDGVRVFRLWLDGSVEKVRVHSLRCDHCIVRARWRVPLAVA
jgi:hypothetical protein